MFNVTDEIHIPIIAYRTVSRVSCNIFRGPGMALLRSIAKIVNLNTEATVDVRGTLKLTKNVQRAVSTTPSAWKDRH